MDCKHKVNGTEYEAYRQDLKESLAEAIYEGQLVVLNLDDSSATHPQANHYPDLRMYYNQEYLPKQLWHRDQLPRVAKNLYHNT